MNNIPLTIETCVKYASELFWIWQEENQENKNLEDYEEEIHLAILKTQDDRKHFDLQYTRDVLYLFHMVK